MFRIIYFLVVCVCVCIFRFFLYVSLNMSDNFVFSVSKFDSTKMDQGGKKKVKTFFSPRVYFFFFFFFSIFQSVLIIKNMNSVLFEMQKSLGLSKNVNF